jgi:hypothetical protein
MNITEFGAFTPQTAAQIALAIAQAGLQTTGKVYYLDAVNGNDQNNGSQPQLSSPGIGPVKTLAAGYALLVDGNNDVLVIVGNGQSSGSVRLSVGFTWAKNAAHLLGICAPSPINARARIAPTAGVTGFTPFFTLSGKGCTFSNVSFFDGFNTGIASQINFVLSGSNNSFYNCGFLGMGDAVSAGDAGSRSMKFVGASENYFYNCQIGLDTVTRTALNASIEFTTGCARNVFDQCIFPALASTAASSLVVIGAAAGVIDRFTLFRRCTFINSSAFSGGAAATGVIKLLASAGGMILLQDCTEFGFTDWGYDAASKLQVLVSGPVPTSNTSGIAIVNT